MKYIRYTFTAAFCALAFAFTVSAQDDNPAKRAVIDWRQKTAVEGNDVGFAVKRAGSDAAIIYVAVAAESISPMEFTVQPLRILKSSTGKIDLEETGRSSSIKMTESAQAPTPSGFAATPQMTIPLPADAGAVRIIAKDTKTGAQREVTLRIPQEGKPAATAVLSGGK